MVGLQGKIRLKWMIWGVPLFQETPNIYPVYFDFVFRHIATLFGDLAEAPALE